MPPARLPALCLALAIPFLPAAAESPPKNLAAALQPFVDGHSLAGAVVLVADKDKVLDLEAVGYLDVAAKKPMPTDAIFWIASQSKPITAAALMMLVDEGKVKLDDPVEKYLPEFANVKVAVKQDKRPTTCCSKPKRPITVRDILSHTSGTAVRLGEGAADARRADAEGGGEELRRDAAAVRAGHQVQLFQRRHQHGRADHRSRQRHVLRGVPRQAAVRAARHEGHDLLARARSSRSDWRSRTSRTRRRTASRRRRSGSCVIRSTTASASRCRPAGCSRRRPMSRGSARWC